MLVDEGGREKKGGGGVGVLYLESFGWFII